MSRRRNTIRSSSQRRRGVATLWATALVALTVLLACWVLNVQFWFSAAQTTQQRLDAMAAAAAPLLLDEDRLLGGYGDPIDDVLAALTEVDRQRRWNNGVGPRPLAIAQDDLQASCGYIESATAPQFTTDSDVVNALRLRALRSNQSSNPLGLLIAGIQKTPNPQLGAETLVALDDLLVGWRPRPELAAPVAPIALELSAWQQAFGPGGLGVESAVFRVAPVAQQGTAALVGFNGFVDSNTAWSQARLGVFPSETSTGEIGPVTADATPVILAGEDAPNSRDAAVLSRLLPLRGEPLAFCVYAEGDSLTNASAGDFHVLGFVAARVTGAHVVSGRLELVLTPSFLIHPTAWTEPWATEHNLYIHKLQFVH